MRRYARYGENILGENKKILVAFSAEKSLATCQKRSMFAQNALKCAAGWGSAVDPAGELTALPRPLAVG